MLFLFRYVMAADPRSRVVCGSSDRLHRSDMVLARHGSKKFANRERPHIDTTVLIEEGKIGQVLGT
jgi:hypothetical protein